jgi:alpha-methylacyl-CoA racemase
MRPLDGVRVLDFSTLLPGPMATLVLAEAGAEVIKFERPGSGEDMRHYVPKVSEDASANFVLLNRGKRSIAANLKDPDTVAKIKRMARSAQVVVEQFRPGVMDRLGLGYEALRAENPSIVYCAITGYGQTGPKAMIAAHDLNYIADTGMLNMTAGADGAPMVPSALVADIGAGSMPAVISILLALRQAEQTGQGSYLDVAMTDNLFTWQYAMLGTLDAGEPLPAPGGALTTGGSPRYGIYKAGCGWFLAVGPVEDRFWSTFTNLIGLEEALKDDAPDPDATRQAVASLLASKTADEWMGVFEGHDVCVNIVRDVAHARQEPHFRERRLFEGAIEAGDRSFAPLPPPFAPELRDFEAQPGYPELGEANHLLDEV